MLKKALKFSNGSICKWNENEPGIRKVQKVADYLGVPIEKLLSRSQWSAFADEKKEDA